MTTRKPSPREKQLLRKLERARGALKVIHILSTFDGGQLLWPPANVADLCKRVLKETEP